jgi:hypothetical protein
MNLQYERSPMSNLNRLLTSGLVACALIASIGELTLPHADAAPGKKKFSLKKTGPSGSAKAGSGFKAPGAGGRGGAKRGSSSGSSIGSTGGGSSGSGGMLNRGK